MCTAVHVVVYVCDSCSPTCCGMVQLLSFVSCEFFVCACVLVCVLLICVCLSVHVLYLVLVVDI